jgi:hypothetical protein
MTQESPFDSNVEKHPESDSIKTHFNFVNKAKAIFNLIAFKFKEALWEIKTT